MKKKNGFTLFELIAVLVILGVVSSIAIPSYNSYKRKAQEALYSSYVANIKDSITTHLEKCLNENICDVFGDVNYFSIKEDGIKDKVINPDDINVNIDEEKCKTPEAKVTIIKNTMDVSVTLKCDGKEV